MLNTFLTEFSAAWKQFIRFPLPAFLTENESEYAEIDGHSALLRPMMPFIGMFSGLIVTVPLWALRLLPGGRLTAALAGTVIVPLVLELMTSWRGLNSFATYFDLRRQGADHEEAFHATPVSMDNPRPAASGIFLMTLYFLRMIFFGVLAYYAPFWIIISLTGSWMIRAELTTLNPLNDYNVSWIRVPSGWEKRHWHFAIAIMILAGLFHLFPTILAFCTAWLAAKLASNLCLETISGINRMAMEALSYAAELVLLFLGVLIYAAPK